MILSHNSANKIVANSNGLHVYGDIHMNYNKVREMADPILITDAATAGWVTAQI